MVLTNSGGSGILAVDFADEYNLCIQPVTQLFSETLKQAKLTSAMVVGNPFDLTRDASAEDYRQVLEIAEQHNLADMWLLIFGDPIPGAVAMVKEAISKLRKPIGICCLGGGQTQTEEVYRFNQNSIPVFPSPERVARVIAALYAHVS